MGSPAPWPCFVVLHDQMYPAGCIAHYSNNFVGSLQIKYLVGCIHMGITRPGQRHCSGYLEPSMLSTHVCREVLYIICYVKCSAKALCAASILRPMLL
jgi:hypothetical protein